MTSMGGGEQHKHARGTSRRAPRDRGGRRRQHSHRDSRRSPAQHARHGVPCGAAQRGSGPVQHRYNTTSRCSHDHVRVRRRAHANEISPSSRGFTYIPDNVCDQIHGGRPEKEVHEKEKEFSNQFRLVPATTGSSSTDRRGGRWSNAGRPTRARAEHQEPGSPRDRSVNRDTACTLHAEAITTQRLAQSPRNLWNISGSGGGISLKLREADDAGSGRVSDRLSDAEAARPRELRAAAARSKAAGQPP